MDADAEEFVKNLLTEEAQKKPSDSCKPSELVSELPEWFDEEEFNKARSFYWENCYAFSSSMLLGLVAVFAVPSILNVLVGSRRSSSVYTAYRRYLSTLLHTVSWFEYELKPGSPSWRYLHTVRSRHLSASLASAVKGTGVVSQRDIALTQFGFIVLSWRSLHAVRSRHLSASLASALKGSGVVSQRDIALTQFGFVGFSMLKPHRLGIRQIEPGQWEAYNHFWRAIGHMLGLEDRYNICRKTFAETREVCRLLQEKVYTPCLENVPEYFEHMARVMLEALTLVNPTVDVEANIFWVKNFAGVPGYVYMEEERMDMQKRISDYLKKKGLPLETGVDAAVFMSPPAVSGLPPRSNRLLYYKHYETLETTPPYKRLDFWGRYRLGMITIISTLYTTFLGRIYFNYNFIFSVWLMKYLPYLAFFKFGIKKSYVNIFTEDPIDDSVPKPNSEYQKDPPKVPWYKSWTNIFF